MYPEKKKKSKMSHLSYLSTTKFHFMAASSFDVAKFLNYGTNKPLQQCIVFVFLPEQIGKYFLVLSKNQSKNVNTFFKRQDIIFIKIKWVYSANG